MIESIFHSFSLELVKIAEGRSEEKRPGYLRGVAAALPFMASKTVADIPASTVEKSVEDAIRHNARPKVMEVFKSVLGKSTGSLAAGSLTAPVFLSGMKDLRDGRTKQQRRKGIAKIVGSGFAFSAGKGLGTGISQHGLSRGTLSELKKVVGAKSVVGTGAATLTALSLANSSRGKGKKDRSLIPAMAAGSVIGATKGGLEEVIARGARRTLTTPHSLRGLAANAVGQGVGAALGAVALDRLTRKALAPGKEKRAEDIYRDRTDPRLDQYERISMDMAYQNAILQEQMARQTLLNSANNRTPVVPQAQQGSRLKDAAIAATLLGILAASVSKKRSPEPPRK